MAAPAPALAATLTAGPPAAAPAATATPTEGNCKVIATCQFFSDLPAAKTEGGTTPSALYYYKPRSTRAALLCGAIGVLLGALH